MSASYVTPMCGVEMQGLTGLNVIHFRILNIHNHRLHTLRLHFWGKFKFKCLVVT